MTDLYHSIPVSRTRLFFSKYLTGLLVWALPALGGFLLTLLLAVAQIGIAGPKGENYEIWANAFRCLYTESFAFFAAYHLILLCITLSGTIFNTLVNIVLLGFDAAITYGVLYVLCDSYLDTFVDLSFSFRNICWLSQPIAIFAMADTDLFGMGPLFVIGSYAVMILNLVFAVLLNKARASEQAETGVELKPLAAFLRILNTVLAGIMGGGVLAFLTENNVIWTLVGIILAGVLAYGIIDIIHQRAFRAFFSHKVLMAVSVAASCLIFLAIRGDWIGYDTYLPMRSNISSATLYLNNYGENSTLHFAEDGYPDSYNYRYNDEESSDFTISDGDLIYQLLESGVAYENIRENMFSESDYVTNMSITVNRRLRCSYQRKYELQGDAIPALKKLVETEEYRNKYYPGASGLYPTPSSINISDVAYGNESLTGTDRDLVLSTYYREFKEQYSLELISAYVQVGSIELVYEVPRTASRYRTTYSIDLPIYSTFTDTIALIKKNCPKLQMSMDGLDLNELVMDVRIPYSAEMGDPRDVIASYYGMSGYPRYEAPYEYDQNIYVTLKSDADLRSIYPHLATGWLNNSGSHYGCTFVYLGYIDMDAGNSRGYSYNYSIYVPSSALTEDWLNQLVYTVDDADDNYVNLYYSPYDEISSYIY
jgi:hypothetical protein